MLCLECNFPETMYDIHLSTSGFYKFYHCSIASALPEKHPCYMFFPCYSGICLENHPIGHNNVVSQDRWSLRTGYVILKCRSFCQTCVVFQDRWSLMAVVCPHSFHCIRNLHGSCAGIYVQCHRKHWLFRNIFSLKLMYPAGQSWQEATVDCSVRLLKVPAWHGNWYGTLCPASQ